MPTSVPHSKTSIPDLPPGFVHRPHLLATLDGGAASALTLVSAPAGSGKTLLLAEWAREQRTPVAWVTLDEDDDDAHRLWSAVLAALHRCLAIPAPSRLHALAVPPAPGPDFLTDVLDAIEAAPVPLVLVIDDCHHLRAPAVLAGLRMFLRRGRPPLRLVLAGRSDPALPIARLRLEERLCEVRSAQLNFSLAETVALLEACALRLAPELVELLHARTSGWAAGLRLAALPLSDHPDPERFLTEFSGDERSVADYLVGEVLSRIPAADLDLLRRTSICDPLPTALAAELSGDEHAADVLASLERSTGLVAASGPHRSEYRVHQLLRTYLAADLRRHGQTLARDLHREAALWCAAEDRRDDALVHAAQAGDPALHRNLVHRWAADMIGRGEHRLLQQALASGPGDGDPWLPLAAAQNDLARADLSTARVRLLGSRGPATDAAPESGMEPLRQATELLAGIALPGTGVGPPPTDPSLAALTLAGRGAARVFACTRPDTAQEVLADLTSARDLAREHSLGFLEMQSLCLLSAAAVTAGDHARAGSLATEAVAVAVGHGWGDSPWVAASNAVLAHAALVQGRPTRAARAAAVGLRPDDRDLDPMIRFALRIARGGATFDLGDRVPGLLELQQAHAQLGATPLPAPLAAAAALLEHRAALLLGSPAAAAASLSRLAARDVAGPEVTLMRAWTDAVAGSHRAVRAGIAGLLDGTEQPVLPSTVVEAWLLEAWAGLRVGNRPAARHAVQTALALAEPLDALRPFALAGQGVRTLIVDQLGPGNSREFAVRALAARRRDPRPSDARLSVRERDVLTRLNSLSSLGEIADELTVSVNTVKSHVRAIYGKLGVTTRRTAVLAGHEQRLLA
ncbi:MAG TPA: LuxR C-terminal-related transcriptional regulator [Blastococcus sp.]|jgi:LuxR family maltose regulon positive regulatory protein|nr:LuxR C-terminal-related transcriptional regulator [Blastococcus sp.]